MAMWYGTTCWSGGFPVPWVLLVSTGMRFFEVSDPCCVEDFCRSRHVALKLNPPAEIGKNHEPSIDSRQKWLEPKMARLLLVTLGLVGYRHMAYRPWSMRARAPAFLPTPGPLRSRAPRQHAPAEQAAGLSYMKAGRSLSRPRGEKRGPRDRVTQLLTTQVPTPSP